MFDKENRRFIIIHTWEKLEEVIKFVYIDITFSLDGNGFFLRNTDDTKDNRQYVVRNVES